MIKKIVSFLLGLVVFVSCNKNSIPQPGTSGSIQYKVNGNDVSFENFGYGSSQYAITWKQFSPTVYSTRYTVYAKKGTNALVLNAVAFTILTDSLKKMIYHYDSTSLFVAGAEFITYNGQGAFVSAKNDYFDIIITDYSNGRVSGTFSGKFTPADSLGTIGPPSSVTVTEGRLNNLEVIY